jgi:hypothetical protein
MDQKFHRYFPIKKKHYKKPNENQEVKEKILYMNNKYRGKIPKQECSIIILLQVEPISRLWKNVTLVIG